MRDKQSSEVGGTQNTLTNLGASTGTAPAGAALISALTGSFLSGVENNPAVPQDLASKAQVKLAAGIPFISGKDLRSQLDKAGVPTKTADAIVKGEHNRSHRRTAQVIVAARRNRTNRVVRQPPDPGSTALGTAHEQRRSLIIMRAEKARIRPDGRLLPGRHGSPGRGRLPQRAGTTDTAGGYKQLRVRQSGIATSALALERSGSTCVPRFPAGPWSAKMPCLPWPSVSRARPSTT